MRSVFEFRNLHGNSKFGLIIRNYTFSLKKSLTRSPLQYAQFSLKMLKSYFLNWFTQKILSNKFIWKEVFVDGKVCLKISELDKLLKNEMFFFFFHNLIPFSKAIEITFLEIFFQIELNA